MMKRSKTLIVYTVVFAVLSIAAVIALICDRPAQTEAAPEKATVCTLTGDVSSLTLVRSGETTSLTFADDVWVMDGNAETPVNQTRVSAMMKLLRSFPAVRVIGTPENLTEYGLDTPTLSVTAKTAAGESIHIAFGNETSGGNVYAYADQLYTVLPEYRDVFDYGFLDLLQYDAMPDLLPSELVSLTVQRGNLMLELFYRADGSDTAYEDIFDWFIGYPYDELTAADTRKAHALFYDVTGLYIYGCAAYKPQDLSVYGLDVPFLSATVVYDLGEGEQTTVLSVGNETGDGYAYVRFDDSDLVLLANAAITRSIGYTAPSDLLPRQVCGIDLATVTKFTATVGGETYTFEGEALKEAKFISWYRELTAVLSTTSAPDTTPGDVYMTFVFERNTTHHQTMTLSYHIYDSNYYLAVFDGRRSQLVDAYTVEDIAECFKEVIS